MDMQPGHRQAAWTWTCNREIGIVIDTNIEVEIDIEVDIALT
jgi:hypothetical protein